MYIGVVLNIMVSYPMYSCFFNEMLPSTSWHAHPSNVVDFLEMVHIVWIRNRPGVIMLQGGSADVCWFITSTVVISNV